MLSVPRTAMLLAFLAAALNPLGCGGIESPQPESRTTTQRQTIAEPEAPPPTKAEQHRGKTSDSWRLPAPEPPRRREARRANRKPSSQKPSPVKDGEGGSGHRSDKQLCASDPSRCQSQATQIPPTGSDGQNAADQPHSGSSVPQTCHSIDCKRAAAGNSG